MDAIRTDLAKHVGHLTPEDFWRFPVWTWCEDETQRGMACPLVTDGHVIDDSEYDVAFIFADLILPDGIHVDGEVLINLGSKEAYGISVFREGDRFNFYGNLVPRQGTLQQLSDWLGKPVDEITPLEYSTAYSYKSRGPIRGILDLHKWQDIPK